ncbi:unnamed protein product [Phytomonas sp. Hart1]|nr:unnamed protein product [Phytomonas sp. Hart1]|eukprot:CCW70320.1 unnamed protein product [Phytomonas sp. isolate Hart1]
MPREIITVQVGQCGNQLGMRWWDVMLQEHKANPLYPDARDSLFHASELPNQSSNLKARCVAIDMEESVLAAMLRGPLRGMFDSNFFVSDVSGAGNNWAVGHMEYGDKYLDAITESIRAQVEACDCLQCFLVMHSMSGGTGSGLGTRVLGMLDEEFPGIYRICPVVFPSRVDDVVTAPYNSCFALKELLEHADCVLPLDNDALARMADRALGMAAGKGNALAGVPQLRSFTAAQPTQTKGLPYDSMNALVAQLLSNLTCAMRFPGPLNMDINEITTNLVPYARLHLLTAGIAPLWVGKHSTIGGSRGVDAMMSSCFSREHLFVEVGDLHRTTALSTALIARGPQITVGDLNRNVGRLRKRLAMPYWNQDGFKTALCGVSPLGHRDSMLTLTNSCAITGKVQEVYDKFMRLYSARSHVHHYERYLALEYFDSTAEEIRSMLDDYEYLATAQRPATAPRCMKDLVIY